MDKKLDIFTTVGRQTVKTVDKFYTFGEDRTPGKMVGTW